MLHRNPTSQPLPTPIPRRTRRRTPHRVPRPLLLVALLLMPIRAAVALAAPEADTPPDATWQPPATKQADDSLHTQARAALAVLDGRLTLNGIEEPVEVLRDRWGVPHIYAQNMDDLFFAQGFVQAQDRLWQMELWRRTTEGRLAEWAGPELVERDRIARLVRYRGDMDAEWASYSPDSRRIITAFVRGVNAWIEQSRDRLPIEFQLTGTRPGPWTPEVCLGRMAGLIMCRNATSEVLRAELVHRLGAEHAARLLPIDPPHALDIPDGLELDGIDQRVTASLSATTAAIRIPLAHAATGGDAAHPALSLANPFAGDELADVGSNNWTIAGRLTETGKPILANDPHRPITLPSLRYLVHLHCPARGGDQGWNVIGGTEPALPGVAIGHNDRIAWGMTIVGTDQQDLYIEETHPDDPNRYRAGDEWLAMRVEREEIAVRGEPAPRTVDLKFTRHGPVIFEDRERRRAYALRWIGSEPGTAGYLGALALDRARNWTEFLDAAQRWKLPSENLVYADVDGHIGWIAAALTPIRTGWDGLLPVPGASGRYEWSGFLPTADLPQRFDPPEGYVATANHNILPGGYRPAISYEWSPPFRFDRIDEVFRKQIAAGRKFTIQDSERLQHDAVSMPARRLLDRLRATAVPAPAGPETAMLRNWDGTLDRDSPAAALFELWLRNLFERVRKSHVPEAVAERYATRLPLQAVLDLLDRPDRLFGDEPAARRDAMLVDSLVEAIAEARERFGPDPAAWRWGRLHQAHFRHMLAGGVDQRKEFVPDARGETPGGLSQFLNLPSVPRSGDGFTPLAAGGPRFGNFDQATGASYRQIVDLSHWDRSVATSVPGQSGQPASVHYGDLLPLWAEGRYFPLLFSRAAVERASPNRLMLVPAAP